MAVSTSAVTALLFAAIVASSPPARAGDDDDDEHVIAIGQTIKGVFESNTPVYTFRGRADDIVTITLTGKTVDQIGVVVSHSDKVGDQEWITGHYMDDFGASGNVRRGDSLSLTLQLPATAEYMIFYRDKISADDNGAPYTLSVTGDGGSQRPVYVRGSISAGIAFVDIDPTYMANATLSIGKQRKPELGVEGVISASLIPADEVSVMGIVGIGVRSKKLDSPFTVRGAIGIAGMRGARDQLGIGARYDFIAKRFDWGFEAARLGRANIFTLFLGVAL